MRAIIVAIATAAAACSPSASEHLTSNQAESTIPVASVQMPELTVEGLTSRVSSPYTNAFCDVIARLRNTGKVPIDAPDFTALYELNGALVASEQGLVEQSIPVGGVAGLRMKHYCPPKGARLSDLSAVSFYDKQNIRLIIRGR